ncbi:MAG: hypothetical protein ABIG39_07630 [Candidatus Micrarchaeota archaeon]
MNSKLFIGLLSMLCLVGLTIAHGGFWQTGEAKGTGEPMPDDVQVQLLEAVHTCDYETAKALSEQ